MEQIGQIELIVEQTTAVGFLNPRLNGDSTSDQAAQEEKRILGTVPVVEPLLRTLHAEQYRSIKDHYGRFARCHPLTSCAIRADASFRTSFVSKVVPRITLLSDAKSACTFWTIRTAL